MDNLSAERAVYQMVDGEWKRLPGYYVLRKWRKTRSGLPLVNPGVPGLGLSWSFSFGPAHCRRFLWLYPGAGSVLRAHPRQTVVEEVVPEPPSIALEEQPEQGPVEEEPPAPAVPAQTTVTPPPTVPRYTEYVVKRGDNLWSIAQELWGSQPVPADR